MEELTKVEEKIWGWVDRDHVGKSNAVNQGTLFGALGFFSLSEKLRKGFEWMQLAAYLLSFLFYNFLIITSLNKSKQGLA